LVFVAVIIGLMQPVCVLLLSNDKVIPADQQNFNNTEKITISPTPDKQSAYGNTPTEKKCLIKKLFRYRKKEAMQRYYVTSEIVIRFKTCFKW